VNNKKEDEGWFGGEDNLELAIGDHKSKNTFLFKR